MRQIDNPIARAARHTTFMLVFALLAVALFACSKASPRATETPSETAVVETPTPEAAATPVATPTPDPAVLLKDGGIAIIRAAYDRLLDQYIDPVEPAPLLEAAWLGASDEANSLGVRSAAAPAFAGDRAAAFSSFSASYAQLIAGLADPKHTRHAAL